MKNYIYDISDIIYNHPGGSQYIIRKYVYLEDCYKYYKFHRPRSRDIWKKTSWTS